MYHQNKASQILPGDKGQMEKLNPEDESVKILLNIVLGKPMEYTESWAHLSRSPQLIRQCS
ncbi:hypothetical protein CASFOL_011516 [Castilleja foliolosa]|uniref:Uncharacterized protein n=1 Tax=Castilleja foliolosa TaxID=1961234 RepID=A0ABD3DX24_9LAMI